MKFAISYDMRREPRIYEPLWAELQRLGAVRVLYSLWFWRGESTCLQLRDHFKQFIDQNDGLLVVSFDDWASYRAHTHLD